MQVADEAFIQVSGLTKYFGSVPAVEDLSFQISSGEVVGFLGLNGAGKSTTLRALGGVLLPTSGTVTLNGVNVANRTHLVRQHIGYLPDVPPLYDDMTVRGYLLFVAQLRGLSRAAAEKRAGVVLEQTSMRDLQDELIVALSHGYRQRVGVAQAVVHLPKLIILDEPTQGLDPVQTVDMRKLIQTLKGEHTVLVSSHILSEISAVCDRLLVLHQGRLLADGTEEELAAQLSSTDVIEVDVAAASPGAEAALKGVASVTRVETVPAPSPAVVRYAVAAPAADRPELVRALVSAGVDVLRVDVVPKQLESIFVQLTQRPAEKVRPL